MATYHAPLGQSNDSLDIRVNPWLGARIFYKERQILRSILFSRTKEQLQGTDGQTYLVEARRSFADILPRIVINGQTYNMRPNCPAGHVCSLARSSCWP